MKCTGKTPTGRPCKRTPIAGTRPAVCSAHQRTSIRLDKKVEAKLVKVIVDAANKGDVRAAIWLLEHGFEGWTKTPAKAKEDKPDGDDRQDAPVSRVKGDPFAGDPNDELATRRAGRDSDS